MDKFCKHCGAKLDEGAIFCDECGAKIGNSVARTNASPNRSLFDLYKIDIIDGEEIIRNSEINIACLIAPTIIVGIGLILALNYFVSYAMYSYYYFNPFVALLIGILNPIFFIGFIWLIIRLIAYFNTDLILTNKRIFGKCGLISTTQMQTPLNKIDSVTFSNGLMGKLLGYGTVKISTTSNHFKFRFIKEGHTLYNDIFHQLEISDDEMIKKQAEAIAEAIDNE